MELNEWIQKLKKSDKLIIVEGKKDKAALNKLGIINVLPLTKPIYAVVEEAADLSKDIIILTDLDPEGKKLYSKLNSKLQDHGCRIDKFFREWLFKNTKLRQIEGLTTHIKS